MRSRQRTYHNIFDKFYYPVYHISIGIILLISIPLIILLSVFYIKNDFSNQAIILSQAMHEWDSYCSNVIAYSRTIADDPKLRSLLTAKEAAPDKNLVENRLMEISGNFPNVKGITLLTQEQLYHSVFLSDEEADDLVTSQWFINFQTQGYVKSFHLSQEPVRQLHYMTTLDSISSAKGYLIVSIHAADSDQIFQSIEKAFPHYALLDNFNSIMVNAHFSHETDLQHQLQEENSQNFFSYYVFPSRHGIFTSAYGTISHWKLVVFRSFREYLLPYIPVFLLLAVAIVMVSFIVRAILKPTINQIVTPVTVLTDYVKAFSYDNYESIQIRTGDEIETLADGFNQMSLRIHSQVENLLAQKEVEHKLRYGLYIAQVNPHFIYNTMNTINYLARKSRCDDIVVVNTALIHLLKDSLRINDSVMDSLETELDVCKQYLNIQQYRYQESHNINVIWEIDPDTLQQQLPKHILQPLVENSLIHGFLDEDSFYIDEEDPFIRISAKIEHGSETALVLTIEDNGIGIDKEKCLELSQRPHNTSPSEGIDENRGLHIGLDNIRYRLHYLLGEKQKFEILPRDPHGTIVIIRLPHVLV